MLDEAEKERCRHHRLDVRDCWTHLHFQRRLRLAAGLTLQRQLEWAQRVRHIAGVQGRFHLYVLAHSWESEVLAALKAAVRNPLNDP